MEVVSIPAIISLVGGLMALIKDAVNKDKFNAFIPLISVILGAGLGVVAFFFMPELIVADNLFSAILVGAVSGWASTGAHQTIKQISKLSDKEKTNNENIGNDA